jgi:hypothetical protein
MQSAAKSRGFVPQVLSCRVLRIGGLETPTGTSFPIAWRYGGRKKWCYFNAACGPASGFFEMNGHWEKVWRTALVVIGVLLSAVGYMVERRLVSIEAQLGVLDSRVDSNSAKIEGNTEALKHMPWDRK